MESQENTRAAAHDSKYRVDAHLDIPEFKATIPSHLMEGMKGHDKFLLEQISVMKNQNQWQTDGSTGTTRQVDVEFTTDEGIARLSAGEFLWMPVSHAGASVGVQLQVNHASNVQLEYAYWTAS